MVESRGENEWALARVDNNLNEMNLDYIGHSRGLYTNLNDMDSNYIGHSKGCYIVSRIMIKKRWA